MTTRLVRRTLNGTTAETKCQRGKVGKNWRVLKIHQARTKCGSGKKQRSDRTHRSDEHYSAKDLLPSEATQIDMEEEQDYPNQRSTSEEPSAASRNKEFSGHQHTANGGRPLMKIWIRSWKIL